MKNGSAMILCAEDDEDDRLLLKEALDEVKLINPLKFVNDGQELIEYLRREGEFSERDVSEEPAILLVDLNMPRLDGREAIKIIKSDPELKKIPIVVLTTSKADEDVVRSYDLGVNSFISKPVDFSNFVAMMTALTDYWLEFVSLPATEH